MAGGLLNIISIGSANVILTGNPTKTFFKVVYSKYTNFGLQKFRIDYEGMRDLRPSSESVFTFKIKRYADLLMDTYIVINLPDIWSPIYYPCQETNSTWASYDFRWIKDIGTHIIQSIEINCGSQTLHRYSGEYLAAMVDRDFSAEKKDLFNRMSGNTAELNDPANAFGRVNSYPSAHYSANTAGEEPSIRGRSLYIPINAWFTLDSRCAFPLISLQYNELSITVTLRPIYELYQVRDVFDSGNLYPYVQPDYNADRYQMYRFLQTPPSSIISSDQYTNTSGTWNADIHLISTYCFLSKEESQLFAAEDQVYLVKDVYEYKFMNIVGSTKLKLASSNGMVSGWMWYLQRNDVNMRNEWSNYTNWPYRTLPSDISQAPATISNNEYTITGPAIHPDTTSTGYFITGPYSIENRREILETMGILLDGDYRENIMTRGIYDYIEKYIRTQGSAKEGLYCYNFCLNTSPFEYQPSGAINLSRFKNIELELTTYVPQFDAVGSSFNVICDNTGNAIGISSKPSWRLYQYNYNMTLFEERYNILSFIGGNCGMLYAK
jgi:hypothetical protein